MFRHLLIFHIILLLLSAVIFSIFIPIGGSLDQYLILPYIDRTQGFVYKSYWWYDHFAHYDLKLFLELIISTIVLAVIYNKLSLGHFIFKQHTQQYSQMLIFMLLSICIVTLLKRYSSHACPWDILQTNQQQIFFIQYPQQGGCFPGGHASLGYAWIAGYFIFYQKQRSLAYFYLLAGLILGTAMGWTQMMRGAHFFSHNLWTFWVTYFVDVILFFIPIMKQQLLIRQTNYDQ